MHGSEWEGRSVTTFSTPNRINSIEKATPNHPNAYGLTLRVIG